MQGNSAQILKIGSVLTACYFESAGLPIHRVELEVHGAGEGERDTNAVQDVAVREDADVDIVYEDVVEVAGLFVAEESVRHPNLSWIRHRQILHPTYWFYIVERGDT